MKTFFCSLILLFSSTNLFANQVVVVPQNPPIITVEPAQVVVPVAPPRILVKTIEWVLVPSVNNIVVQDVRTGLFGRQYIVNRNELVTTWVYVPVKVWK